MSGIAATHYGVRHTPLVYAALARGALVSLTTPEAMSDPINPKKGSPS
jgi:hypothetical protein